jgi:hypothetical protein
MERCSDPYGCGCRGVAVAGMRVWTIKHYPVFNEPMEIEHLWINLCRDCMYWNCDHDWEGEARWSSCADESNIKMCCAEPIKAGEWWKDIRGQDRSITFASESDALQFLALGRQNVEPELQRMYDVVQKRMETTR